MGYEFSQAGTQVMGILNVTPDSFSDGGRYLAPAAAVERALQIQAEGADLLDIGGQSTRPGHVPVCAAEELRRLRPVLEDLRGKLTIPVSVDTYYPEVADAALQWGACMVNDVSGTATAEMAAVVKRHGAGWILMHNGGGADAAQEYRPDAVTAVRAALQALAAQAMALGIPQAAICLDPGIGFGKTMEDNLRLLACTAQVRAPGFAYLVGASRKRAAGGSDAATIALHSTAQWQGANILRVHAVREAVAAKFAVCAMKGLTGAQKCVTI
jgi:dihydropteroate synthase